MGLNELASLIICPFGFNLTGHFEVAELLIVLQIMQCYHEYAFSFASICDTTLLINHVKTMF